MSKMTDEQVMHALRNFPRITEIGGVPCDWLAVNMGATTECLPWAVAFELVRGVLEDQQTQSLALPRGEDRLAKLASICCANEANPYGQDIRIFGGPNVVSIEYGAWLNNMETGGTYPSHTAEGATLADAIDQIQETT